MYSHPDLAANAWAHSCGPVDVVDNGGILFVVAAGNAGVSGKRASCGRLNASGF
ncbi:hypothetical protein [Lysobacter sp. 1R34A]|uniref:hypothetical protein n=1 Tax=Lysobacter sp. 1R34A TaxID=3445786 RepID=UPI003EEC1D0F